MDDASNNPPKRNEQINALSGCRYVKLDDNIGKSKIKNRLAEEAKGDWLLMMDDDGLPESDEYINNLFRLIKRDDVDVICGGRTYQEEMPSSEYYLHWLYGREREVKSAEERKRHPYNGFMIANMCIRKSVFMKIRLDERMRLYGHEDSVFGMNLKREGVRVLHVDNPLRHIGLVRTRQFIENQAESVNSVALLIKGGQENVNLIRLANVYKHIRKWHLDGLISKLEGVVDKHARKKMMGRKPCLKWLDYWKLTLLCGALRR